MPTVAEKRQTLAKLKQRMAKKKTTSKKKTKTTKSVAVSPSQREFDFDREAEVDLDEQAKQIGQNIKAVARAFRLRFKDVSKSRKLPEAHKQRVAEAVDCDVNQLRLTTILYAQHPAIKELSTKKAALKEMWRAFTLPYPSEAGVRLFPVRGDSDEERQQEVRDFLTNIYDKIRDFRDAVSNLANNWDEVLQLSQERLRSVYNADNYPLAAELHDHITCEFEPFNFELPNYLKNVSPEEYEKQAAALNRKFEEVVQKQSQLIEEAMATSLDQMVASVQGWADGKKRSFKNSAVENVFKALEEFKRNTERFGILDGTPLARQFDQLHKLLQGVGDDSKDISTSLRRNEGQREAFMARATELRDSILEMSSERTRRKILRASPEAPQTESPQAGSNESVPDAA